MTNNKQNPKTKFQMQGIILVSDLLLNLRNSDLNNFWYRAKGRCASGAFVIWNWEFTSED